MIYLRYLFIYTFLLHATMSCAWAQRLVKAEYFIGENFEKKFATSYTEGISFHCDVNKAPLKGMPSEHYSIRWTAKILAPESGEISFMTTNDDGVRVFIDKKMIINAWGPHDHDSEKAVFTMQKGKVYEIQVDYYNGIREGEMALMWHLPSYYMKDFHLSIHESFFYTDKPKPTVAQTPPPPKVKPQPKPTPKPAPKPEPKPTPKPEPKPSVSNAVTIDLGQMTQYVPRNVQFEKSQAIMLPEAYPELDNMAQMLLKYPNKTVQINGHTDKIGDAAANLRLSEQRARAVGDYLITKGVVTSRIQTKGYGDTRPLVPSDGKVFHPQNRRVEFIIKN